MIIDEFIKSIGKSVKSASGKIDNAVDVQKTKYKITKKNEEIDEIYKKLGKEVADAAIKNEDYSSFITAALVEISAIKKEIEKLNKERIEKEGKILCSCGNEVDSKSDFCNKCGAKIERPDKTEEKNSETAEKNNASSEEGNEV